MDVKSNFYVDGLPYDEQLKACGQWEMGNEFFLYMQKNKEVLSEIYLIESQCRTLYKPRIDLLKSLTINRNLSHTNMVGEL